MDNPPNPNKDDLLSMTFASHTPTSEEQAIRFVHQTPCFIHQTAREFFINRGRISGTKDYTVQGLVDVAGVVEPIRDERTNRGGFSSGTKDYTVQGLVDDLPVAGAVDTGADGNFVSPRLRQIFWSVAAARNRAPRPSRQRDDDPNLSGLSPCPGNLPGNQRLTSWNALSFPDVSTSLSSGQVSAADRKP